MGEVGRSWEKLARWLGAHWGTCFGSWRIVSQFSDETVAAAWDGNDPLGACRGFAEGSS